MKTLMFSKAGVIGLLAAFGLLYSATVSFAVDIIGNVTVNTTPISITPGLAMELDVNAPVTASTQFMLNPIPGEGCSVVGGSGFGTCGDPADNAPGTFTIVGPVGLPVAFVPPTAGLPCSDPLIEVFGLLLLDDANPGEGAGFNSLTFTTLSSASTSISWGGQFSVSAGAGNAVCTIPIDVAFNPGP